MFILNVKVPFGTKAQILLPNGDEHQVTSGNTPLK